MSSSLCLTAHVLYSNRSKLIELLSLSRYAYEVSRMDIKKPNKLRDAHTIPTDLEMEFLCNAAVNPGDREYIEMSREHDERIGGLGKPSKESLCGTSPPLYIFASGSKSTHIRTIQKRRCGLI